MLGHWLEEITNHPYVIKRACVLNVWYDWYSEGRAILSGYNVASSWAVWGVPHSY